MSSELLRAEARAASAPRREPTIDVLAGLCLRLAAVVQACSRRRDAREVRSKIVLGFLRRRCPVHGVPREPWYVPGASARLGITGLRRVWFELFDEEPPSERRLRSHVSVLERAAALVRQPGEWHPTPADGPRLQWPDTIHVLDDERDARWWSEVGHARLSSEPDAKRCPSLWRRLFKGWRDEARDPQDRFAFPRADAAPAAGYAEPAPDAAIAAATLRALPASAGPFAMLAACLDAGARVSGNQTIEALVRRPLRLRGAMFDLARELSRGTRVRNRAGFLIWAYRARGGPR